MNRCIIFAAGEYYDNLVHIQECDFIIAADAGLRATRDLGIAPRLIIGDFDSLGELTADANPLKDISHCQNSHAICPTTKTGGNVSDIPSQSQDCEIIRLPVEKDETDTAAAIREAMRRGCREFHIYGGTGGRLDHTLANIQCLANLAKEGLRGFLYGNGFVVTVLNGGNTLRFAAESSGTISVFAHSTQASGVTLCGLKYHLTDAVLTSDVPLGVSNAFIGHEATISLRHGALVVVYPNSAILL
jgi:thiamine pyrophosphokinase